MATRLSAAQEVTTSKDRAYRTVKLVCTIQCSWASVAVLIYIDAPTAGVCQVQSNVYCYYTCAEPVGKVFPQKEIACGDGADARFDSLELAWAASTTTRTCGTMS